RAAEEPRTAQHAGRTRSRKSIAETESPGAGRTFAVVPDFPGAIADGGRECAGPLDDRKAGFRSRTFRAGAGSEKSGRAPRDHLAAAHGRRLAKHFRENLLHEQEPCFERRDSRPGKSNPALRP